ncbi:hypothetical protein ACFV1L_21995 [Kitasatospora sp. NPDC059646]|uniref:hypothetical protein n=1 Tax=Kitasatospora sp. NPDC059646 TaxID=3346893 RepID=UPI003674EDFB
MSTTEPPVPSAPALSLVPAARSGEDQEREQAGTVATAAPPSSPAAAGAGGGPVAAATGAVEAAVRPSTQSASGLVGSITGPGEEAVAPQHATEINLRRFLAKLSNITERAFARHDGTAHLMARATRLRRQLDDFQDELRVVHNIVGKRTNRAVARMAEQVEVMKKSIEEIGALSLAAAELSEVAESAIYDEYQPITTQTADVGLVTPSARIHNQD